MPDSKIKTGDSDKARKCCSHCGFIEAYSSFRTECPICERDLHIIKQITYKI